MKNRFILIILTAVAMSGYAQDTVFMCNRVSNYFYTDMWIDQYSRLCNGGCDIRGTLWDMPTGQQSIVVKYCEIDTSLRVIGVAAPVYIKSNIPYADPNRDTEYFYLFDLTDTGCVLLGKAPWHSASSPSWMMEFNLAPPWYAIYEHDMFYYPVYEAYFEKGITVSDSFYVGGSTFNNGPDPSNPSVALHPQTFYLRWMCHMNADSCGQFTFGTWAKDRIAQVVAERPTEEYDFVTNSLLWPGFGAIFPIFDTVMQDTTHTMDTCLGTTGLRVLDISGNNVYLNWDAGGNNAWELSIVKGDTLAHPDSGIINSYNDALAILMGLDSVWYKAYVRTVCNGDQRSEWSRGVSFNIACPGREEKICSAVDRYTTVMPNPTNGDVVIFSSFKLSKVEIYAADGSMVGNHPLQGTAATLDVSNLPKGIYFFRVTTPSGVTLKKVVRN